MTNEELKEKAQAAAQEIVKYFKGHRREVAMMVGEIENKLQPLIDADREKIERLEKALEFYAYKENYRPDEFAPGNLVGDGSDEDVWEYDHGHIARTALGEE